jgi:hypothetical protein
LQFFPDLRSTLTGWSEAGGKGRRFAIDLCSGIGLGVLPCIMADADLVRRPELCETQNLTAISL